MQMVGTPDDHDSITRGTDGLACNRLADILAQPQVCSTILGPFKFLISAQRQEPLDLIHAGRKQTG